MRWNVSPPYKRLRLTWRPNKRRRGGTNDALCFLACNAAIRLGVLRVILMVRGRGTIRSFTEVLRVSTIHPILSSSLEVS